MITGALVFILVASASYAAVALVRRIALERDRVALPNARSLHSGPVPYGGGLVIAVICIVAYLPISYYFLGTFSWGYFTGACLVAIVSYVDDVKRVGFVPRLLVHSLAAAILIVDLDTWHGVTALGGLHLGYWAYVLTLVWIVWMINSYNFMDGIDGLAGLQAVIAGAGWCALGYMLDMPALYFFALVISASASGFLIHNWPPARIFMGDVGSAFLGYTFAALPLLARHMANHAWDLVPIAAVLFVWFFLFDSLFTRFRRLVRGENVLIAHREHLFQRLVASGLTHQRVSVIYGVLASVLGLSVLASILFRVEIGWIMFAFVGFLTLALLALCGSRGVLFKEID